MLNKIEKHRIENIINNLDENHGLESITEEEENEEIDATPLFDSAIDENLLDDSFIEENVPLTEKINETEPLIKEPLILLEKIDEVMNIPIEKFSETINTGLENLNSETVNETNIIETKSSDTISENTNSIEAKVATLKEVQIRLKRLSDEEILEYSSSYRKKFKMQDLPPTKRKNNLEQETACLNCTGCTALKHICNLKVSSFIL